jgi:hypothetical protein
MGERIELTAAEVPAMLRRVFPEYNGRRWRAVVETSTSLDDTYWSGGTKSEYRGINLVTGEIMSARAGSFGTFYNPREPVAELAPGLAIVEHSFFTGKDMGITIHIHPANVAQLRLSAPLDLTDDEKAVLEATAAYKSSYGGDPEYRRHESGLSKDRWETAKASCIAKGLLDKRGAITVTGRNARTQAKRPSGGKRRHAKPTKRAVPVKAPKPAKQSGGALARHKYRMRRLRAWL